MTATIGAAGEERLEAPPPGRRAHVRAGDRRTLALALGAALAAAAALHAATAGLPYFAESWTHRARAEGYASVWRILDPLQVPFRPLQHLAFVVVAALDLEPWAARLPAFALHVAAAGLVHALVRALGGSGRAGLTAALLYLAFPSVKGLAYVAAIGTPGRAACVLLGLAAAARHARAPSAASGATLLGAQVVALGFHQAGVVLAAGAVLLAAAAAEGPPRARLRAAARRLRDPWLVATVAVALALTLGMAWLYPRAYPRSAPLAVLANLARAALALAPEGLRFRAIEGLRGNAGSAGLVLGAAAVLGAGALGLAFFARARPASRALLVVVAADLALHAASSGFVVRYAQLSAALLACVLALELGRLPAGRARRAALAGVALLGLGWATDTWRDVAELREAGRIADAVLADAAAARRAHGAAPIALVDLPPMHGRERDAPLFLWGTALALAERGGPGPWRFHRTAPFPGSTESELVDEAHLRRLARQGVVVLRYDPRAGRLAPAGGPRGG